MATVVETFAIEGIEGYRVEIEASSIKGVPNLSIVGLPDQSIKESGDRVESAMSYCGYKFPATRLIVNLAPSDTKKRGSHYDLGIAIALLLETEQIELRTDKRFAFIGELSLNGNLRPVNGILPMIIEAKRSGISDVIVPRENAQEAMLVGSVNIYGLGSIREAIDLLQDDMPISEINKFVSVNNDEMDSNQGYRHMDFSEVKGQDSLIRAVTLGVAGGHNILMIGEPGCGKTMIAERIPTIMPSMTETESLEVTKIHSVAGMLPAAHSLVTTRPFRSPHHNASLNALVGGGNPPQPGEVSLAHNGVLFLDELPEFSISALESLRQPMENDEITIARVGGTSTYPTNFMFVSAMNPCPCGYYPSARCTCNYNEIKRYKSKLSGPILDRIDIQKFVRPVDYFELSNTPSTYTSAELINMVETARLIQRERYKENPNINSNAQMTSNMIREYCQLDAESESLLKERCDLFRFSARIINKLLKVARTSADLCGRNDIAREDIENVLSCRELDAAISIGRY